MVNFLEYPGQGTLGCHSLSSLICGSGLARETSSLGTSAAPQTFTLTPASYSHSTSTSLHSIGFINSFCFSFFFKSKRISSNYRAVTSKHHQATWKSR